MSDGTGDLPQRAQVVIVGGGVIGTSIAYHLTKVGITDVLLLERHQLTAGTTWHAAGLITSAGFTDETTLWMAEYSRDLYERLESETGFATGFMKIGHLHLATSPQRLEAMRREHAFQTGFGVESHLISAAEVAEMWPMARVDDVLGAIYNPNDGRANPVDVTMSMARGARDGGARIVQGVGVSGLRVTDGRVTGVDTDRGPVEADQVVLACGMWTRDLAAAAGVNVPLQAAEHYYLLTEPFEGCHRELPVIEDPAKYGYYREEGGGLLVGLFEPVGAAWKPEGIPHDAAFTTLDPDWERMAPFVEDAIDRIPALKDVGIKQLFCGPESFTTNLHPHLGPTPEVDGLWVAAGLNSLGILLGGGVGTVMAHWMTEGVAPQDVTHYHVDRALPYEATRAYRTDRTVELLGALFGDSVFPNWEPVSARGIRRSAIHADLVAQGASFGVSMGWEFPLWFAGEGQRPDHPTPETAFGRGHSFERARLEHVAVREAVGVMDMSLMAKFRVTGPDACRVLNHLSAADVDTEIGKVVYTPWCNPGGGMEADLTVTRLGEDDFNVVTSDVIQTRILWMIRRAIKALGADAHVVEHTSGTALFTVQGPELAGAAAAAVARRLLQRGLSLPVGPAGRDRLRPGPGPAGHLPRRTGLGAARARRPRSRGLRVPVRRRRRVRPGADGPVGPQLAAAGEGVPRLRPRHRQPRHPARGRVGLHRRLGQGRLRRPRRPRRPEGGRCPHQAPPELPAGRSRALAPGHRARLPGRDVGGLPTGRGLRAHARGLGRPRLGRVRGGRHQGLDRVRHLGGRRRRRPLRRPPQPGPPL